MQPATDHRRLSAGLSALGGLGPAAIVIAALYFARDVLVPVALAILLSFVLAPLVNLLQKAHVPKLPAVIVVVFTAFAVLSALAGLMGTQVAQLGGNLPQYQDTIREKIQSLRGSATSAGSTALERAADVLQDLRNELEKPQQAPAPSNRPQQPSLDKPIPVEVRAPDPGPIETISRFISPLVHPLTTTGLVIIFVVFILAQREDLRNRFIRLAGTGDLQKTTAALDDAAHRLSRLFLAQLALNAAFGAIIGMGLWLIGVPSALLWGMIAAVLRFVPYIGAFIAAAFPLALAAAVDPGWTLLLWTAALFLIVEPIIGHVIEPLLYGRSTGLSPVAIVTAATFWTWLWGPIGLVLSTPLTVCMVVLGRHVDQFQFLDIMFGDRPALTAPELFYQRTLAADPAEIAEKAAEFLKERPLVIYLDDVALPALRLAKTDQQRGKLTEDRQERIRDAVAEAMEDLPNLEHHEMGPSTDPEAEAAIEAVPSGVSGPPILSPEELSEDWRGSTPIICVGARDSLDEAAALLLAAAMTKHVAPTKVMAANALIRGTHDFDGAVVRMIYLTYLDMSSTAHVRYLARRCRRNFPNAKICVCFSDPAAPPNSQTYDLDCVSSSIGDAVEGCVGRARAAFSSQLIPDSECRAEIASVQSGKSPAQTV